MPQEKKILATGAVVLGLALTMLGCSDDDNDGSSTDPTEAPTETTAATDDGDEGTDTDGEGTETDEGDESSE